MEATLNEERRRPPNKFFFGKTKWTDFEPILDNRQQACKLRKVSWIKQTVESPKSTEGQSKLRKDSFAKESPKSTEGQSKLRKESFAKESPKSTEGQHLVPTQPQHPPPLELWWEARAEVHRAAKEREQAETALVLAVKDSKKSGLRRVR